MYLSSTLYLSAILRKCKRCGYKYIEFGLVPYLQYRNQLESGLKSQPLRFTNYREHDELYILEIIFSDRYFPNKYTLGKTKIHL